MILVTIIVNVTGLFLKEIKTSIGSNPEVYVVYPALIDTIGDVGSIVGSTATTKLFTGIIRPSILQVKNHLYEIFGAWSSSIIMFTLYSGIVSLYLGFSSGTPMKFLTVLLSTNLLASAVMIFFAYATAILTFRLALNPDNFVIPIESSVADTVTTISLFLSLLIIT